MRHLAAFAGPGSLALAAGAAAFGSTPPFSAQVVQLGGAPRQVAIEDVDGDGDADLVVLSASPIRSAVAVVLNEGGTFVPGWRTVLAPLPFELPVDLETGDLDGDGDPDLVLNLPFADASSRLNAGDGTFALAQPIALAGQRVDNELAELGGDASLDLAYYELDLIGYVGTSRGEGDGTFAQGPELPVTSYDARARAALGDVTGDGLADLVLATGGGLVLVRGAPGATVQGWQGPATLLAPGDHDDVTLADLDGDGALDVVASRPAAQAVAVLLGAPPGPPGPAVLHPAGLRPLAVETADLDGDGRLDVVVTDRRSGTVVLLLGEGGGALGPPASVPAGERPEDVAAGDLDGDGDVDLAVADPASGRVIVLLAEPGP